MKSRIPPICVAVAVATVAPLAQTPAPAPQNPQRGTGRSTARRSCRPRLWLRLRRADVEPGFSKKPPVQPLTPEEQAKKFWLLFR